MFRLLVLILVFTARADNTTVNCLDGQWRDETNQTTCNNCMSIPNATTIQCTNSTDQTIVTCDAGYYGKLGDVSCQLCGPGSITGIIGTGATNCTKCAAGQYSLSSNVASCSTCVAIANATTVQCTNSSNQKIETCDAGYYGNIGDASCQLCPAGSITNTGTSAGATTCTECAAGNYSESSNVASCQLCPAGSITGIIGTGATTCTECAAGNYSESSNVASCSTCTSIPNATTVQCTNSTDQTIVTCDAGYYGNPGDATCKLCAAGSITNTGTATGATTCTACVAGQYSESSNVTECSNCDAGQYQNATGQANCNDCDAGKYQNSAGESLCKTCVGNSTSDRKLCECLFRNGSVPETNPYNNSESLQCACNSSRCTIGEYCYTNQGPEHDRCSTVSDTFPVCDKRITNGMNWENQTCSNSEYVYFQQCPGEDVAASTQCRCTEDDKCEVAEFCIKGSHSEPNYCSNQPKCQYRDGQRNENSCACSLGNMCGTGNPSCNNGTCQYRQCQSGGIAKTTAFDTVFEHCTCQFANGTSQLCSGKQYCFNPSNESGLEGNCTSDQPRDCKLNNGLYENTGHTNFCLCRAQTPATNIELISAAFCTDNVSHCNNECELMVGDDGTYTEQCSNSTPSCSATPNPTCTHTNGDDGTGMSFTTTSCMCDGTMCLRHQFCDVASDLKCLNQTCKNYKSGVVGTNDIDDLCYHEGYGNGLKDNEPQCSSAQCDKVTDWEQCCKQCPTDKISDFGVCRSNCSEGICKDTWRRPLLTLDIVDIQNAYPRYTDNCFGYVCDVDDDLPRCCIQNKTCAEQDPDVLGCSLETKYTRNLTNATCVGLRCTREECCESKECFCTGGEPSDYRTCPAEGDTHCEKCNIDTHWMNYTERICHPISNCTAQQYQQRDRTIRSDRECEDLTVCNASTQYVSTNHTKTFDRQCSNITSCNETTQYETVAPTLYSDRSCGDLAVCNGTHYRSAHLNCTAKTVCNETEYEHSPGNLTSDRVCLNIRGPCDFNTHFEIPPIPRETNRVCVLVRNCSQKTATEKTNTTDRICANWTTCTVNQWEVTPVNKTTNTDRHCSEHTTCSPNTQWQTSAGTTSSDANCQNLTNCNANLLEYEVVKPNQTRDRECANCSNASCIGCMTSTDCDYDSLAKIHNGSMCFGKNCTFHSVGDTVQYGENVRFDGLYNFTGGFNIVTGDNYTYFKIPLNYTGSIQYYSGSTWDTLQVKRDCYFELKEISRCTSECGKLGSILYKRINILGPKNEGEPCPPNLYTSESCVNATYKCPINCTYTVDYPQNLPCNANCSKTGTRLVKNVTMVSAEKFNGTRCPEDEYEECVRTPPAGHCDCDGNSYDHCGVCGGNDICKGCDGMYYTTFRAHVSYESEKSLYRGSGIKPIRNKCGECGFLSDECSKKMKLMASKKEKRSEYQEKLVPALFIVLFVVFMVAVFVYMITSKKKYQAVPTVEISDEKKYHKSVILNF